MIIIIIIIIVIIIIVIITVIITIIIIIIIIITIVILLVWHVNSENEDPFLAWILAVANDENPPSVNSISWGTDESVKLIIIFSFILSSLLNFIYSFFL